MVVTDPTTSGCADRRHAAARRRESSVLRLAAGGALLILAGVGRTTLAQEPPAPVPAGVPTTQPEEQDLTNIDLYQLKLPVVVTAGRHEQQVATVPYAVTVITADDIRRSGARSIPDALRQVPGMDVAELSAGNYAVSPRGFHSFLANKTLVLVDGRQIFDATFGGTLWGNWPFQLEDIERIEVVRGPAGLTWGPNAVNGVINIITKDPADQRGLTVTGGGGSRGTNKEHAGYAFQVDKLRLRVSSEFEGHDGFKPGGTIFGNSHDEYKTGRAAVHAIYDATPQDTVTFSGGSSVLDGGWYGDRLPFQPYLQPKGQANYLLGTWEHRLEAGGALRLAGYVNDFWVRNASPAGDIRYQQFALQLGHTFHPAEKHTLTWGVDTRFDLVSAANADPYILAQDIVRSGDVGVYVLDEWQLAPKWLLHLGLRGDYDAYGGFQPSGRAALSYQINDASTVYGAVSRAFHMAPAAERFLNIPVVDPFLHVTTDRDIDPETLIAYELGYRGKWLDRFEIEADCYWHSYGDLADRVFRLGPPGLFQARSQNAVDLSTYGVELGGKYAVTDALRLLGNYTFERPDKGYGTLGDSISMPRHKFMVGTQYDPLRDLHLSSYLYFVDAVKTHTSGNPSALADVPAYFRWDLRAEYDFWKDRASVAVGVRNLLDHHHPEGGSSSLESAEAPRTVYAEMRMTLK